MKTRIEPKIQTFKLSQLKSAKYNPRTITAEAMAGLTASIEKFGCVEPIVVNVRSGKNTIIGGHQRCRILKELHGAGYECPCVTVDLSKTNEKLLNITLNNPKVQGEFVAGLGEYIEKMRTELADDEQFLDLRIDQLRSEIGKDGDTCTYKEEKLRPFKKTHVLLSFEPSLLAEIAEHLEAIVRTEGVEYEQCSN